MAYTYKKRVNTNSKHSANYGTGTFSKNPSTGGNCTWWAWERFREVYKNATGKSLSWTAGGGNACAFYRIMGKAGYKTGKTPKPGAIICWGYNGVAEGNPGHVAFVEQVFKNGDIEISQSGWSSGPIANQRITKKSGYKFNYNNAHFNGFIYNKVEFTNPDGTMPAGGADHPKEWYINKYGNEARVYFNLIDLGYSHKGACAIMGNISQESNFSTSVMSSDGYGSKGLCQWTGGRLTNLKNFASEKGMKWTSVKCQCQFLDKELKSYKNLRKRLIAGTDKIYDLTYDFCFTFERPAEWAANMPNRSSKAKTYYDRYSGAGSGEGGEYFEEEGSAGINMAQRASQLYSSNNYKWVKEQENEQDPTQAAITKQQQALKDFLSNLKIELKDEFNGAVPDTLPLVTSQREKIQKVANTVLSISQAMVEAPFVEVNFDGIIVGTYKNSLDDFPNHISKLEVDKINGEINKYCFELIHQIRPGEDPNLLDKVFARVRYSKIGIKYGDYNSNTIYGDEKAVITNIAMNRDYVSNRITYTIFATSAGEFVTSYKLNFPARTAKPSTVIYDLLYNNNETSPLLLDAFPGMSNSTIVSSKNLIPQNDTVVDIDEKINVSTIEYINYLVSCMSNQAQATDDIIRNSSYYISYENDFANKIWLDDVTNG